MNVAAEWLPRPPGKGFLWRGFRQTDKRSNLSLLHVAPMEERACALLRDVALERFFENGKIMTAEVALRGTVWGVWKGHMVSACVLLWR